MTGRRNLLFLHAALYPIDGTAELAIAIRGAGSQFASQYMLAQALLAWPAPRYPIGGTAKPVIAAPYPIDRVVELAIATRGAGSRFASQYMLAQALPGLLRDTRLARRRNLLLPLHTRLMGRRNLLLPLAPLAVGLPASKCSPVFYAPRTRRRKSVCQRANALPFLLSQSWGMGRSPMITHRP